MSDQKCPKCHYIRTEKDRHILEGICPSCGIAYDKWEKKKNQNQIKSHVIKPAATQSDRPLHRLKNTLLFVPEKIDLLAFWIRVIIYFIFFFWGWKFILSGSSWQAIMDSFMHNVNLPFHEFGHVLFMPFGRFMTILGGSLFQVLWPFIIAMIFIIKQKDNFAASIMIWWMGQSFMDIAPYIADASERSIPLVGGNGKEGHDWGNLLDMLNWLPYDKTLAHISFSFGVLCMLFSFVWGGYLLFKQHKIMK